MKPLGKTTHVHFVGIGGIGMSGIAELLLNLGYGVSGSDLRKSAATRRLRDLGAQVFEGHHPENVSGADVVVYSSAVPPNNPEIIRARDRGIPVIPRAEMLAELMRLKYGIAVAGAHGKTTTTSMIASVLTRAGLDPTVVIGGRLDMWGGSNAILGQGDILVAEADESDGSFLALSPSLAVVTNIDQEHLDFYGNMEALRETFVSFMNKVPFYGAAILCLDDEEIQKVLPRITKRVVTYGMSTQADLQARHVEMEGMTMRFDISWHGRVLGRLVAGMPGRHNLLNALAATAVALELDLELEVIARGLQSVGGLARRFQHKGEASGIQLIDDYGHHPAEISATLQTARACWPERRLIVVFQPHRYSRTKLLLERFAISFNEADVLLVIPIYAAGEPPLEGVSAEALAHAVKEHGHREVHYLDEAAEAPVLLRSLARPGDVVITMGAGDVYRVGQAFLATLREEQIRKGA